MRRPLTALLVLLGALFGLLGGRASLAEPAPTPPSIPTPGERHLVILHTNDVHGQVSPRPAVWLEGVNPLPDCGGLPRLAARLRQVRAEAEAAGAVVLVCDGGDWFQGTPEGQVDRGRAFMGALGAVGYDGMVVGNHEFDHGVDVLVDHLQRAPLPALLANARDADGAPLAGVRESVVVERGGLRVALVGLLTTGTPSITHASTRDLRWEDPAAALGRVRAALGDEVDLVIPVTHMGVEEDVALARAHPDLPLIVGGHSHTFLKAGVREGGTLITQAGAKASVIGRVDLWLDGRGEVARATAVHLDLYDELESPRNEEVDRRCAAIGVRVAGMLDEVVGVLGRPLRTTRRPLVNSSAGNFIADLMRERTGADVALHNRGGIRTTLRAGPVTRRDLFMLLPFSNHLETLTMDGASLRELFRRSVEGPRPVPLEFSGVTLEVRRDPGGQVELLGILGPGGAPVADTDTLRVTTNSFLAAGGDGWSALADAPGEREVDLILLRELLEVGFDRGPRTPSVEQRYRLLP